MRVSVDLNLKIMTITIKIYINYKITDFNKKYCIIYKNKSNFCVLDKLYRLGKILNKISNKLH